MERDGVVSRLKTSRRVLTFEQVMRLRRAARAKAFQHYKSLTTLESLVVEQFHAKGGEFVLDGQGDLHAVLGTQRAGLYFRHGTAPWLVFGNTQRLPKTESRLIERALIKAGTWAALSGPLRHIRVN
jgi:hypothetical protein